MAAKTVNFIVLKPDMTAWVGAVLTFTLSRDDYTETQQIPAFTISADPTDSDGVGSVDLWQNADGQATNPTSYYTCTLPDGNTFRFNVTTGETDAELGTLRAAYS